MSQESKQLSFTVGSIDCIACSPIFKRELQKIHGVKSVIPLVMLNKFKVEYDPSVITREQLSHHVIEISNKIGAGIVFDP